jgi:hypothetical protein
MRPAFALIILSIPLLGCWPHEHDVDNDDAGPRTPAYVSLDKSIANLFIAVAPDDQTAQVALSLQSEDGAAVVMQQGQTITVDDLALPELDGGAYGKLIPGAASYSVTVDEPEHGVLSTLYTPPGAFSITSTDFDLAGTTLTWSPIESLSQIGISLSQQTPDGPQHAEFDLPSDTGSRTFTDLELQHFVQGFPLTVRVTKSNVGEPLAGTFSSTVTISRAREVSLNPTSSL